MEGKRHVWTKALGRVQILTHRAVKTHCRTKALGRVQILTHRAVKTHCRPDKPLTKLPSIATLEPLQRHHFRQNLSQPSHWRAGMVEEKEERMCVCVLGGGGGRGRPTKRQRCSRPSIRRKRGERKRKRKKGGVLDS